MKVNGHHGPQLWQLHNLTPTPAEEWDRLQDFLDIGPADRRAMVATVEPLFRRGPELVVNNYNYLLEKRETAAILGWESGADPAHLEERRRFFTIWLARTLGMDLSHDFARYLFRAGQKHAGHGPRHVHVPELYVTGAISLVHAAFSTFLMEELGNDPVIPVALAGWNKLLTLHMHMMLMGYQVARRWDEGAFPVEITLFGKMRSLVGQSELSLRQPEGASVTTALRTFFDYYPHLRPEVFDVAWDERERVDEQGRGWLEVERAYQARPGWRVLLNGRDIAYEGGIESALQRGDRLSIFPPGR